MIATSDDEEEVPRLVGGDDDVVRHTEPRSVADFPQFLGASGPSRSAIVQPSDDTSRFRTMRTDPFLRLRLRGFVESGSSEGVHSEASV